MKPQRERRQMHVPPEQNARTTWVSSFSRQRLASWLALIGMFVVSVTPAGAQQIQVPAIDTEPSVRPAIADVRLAPDGQLAGRVESVLHVPVTGVHVRLSRTPTEPAHETTTDGNGEFVFRELAPGQYQLTCNDTAQIIRVWTAASAPPAATAGLVVVQTPTTIVRGQQPLCNLFCNEPIMIGVLVAAAIAIPLALHDSGDRSNGS